MTIEKNKMFLTKWLLVFSFVGLVLSAEAEPAKKMEMKFSEGGDVVFYNLSGGDEGIIKRTMEYVGHYGQLKVRQEPLDVKQVGSLEAQVEGFDAKVPEGIAFRAVLVDVKDDPAHAQFDPDKRLVVVNLAPLRSDDAEKFARRLDRQVMRGLFYFGDQKSCPNPQCALWDYKEMKQLDMIGRGPCPPCMIRGRQALKKKGFSVKELAFAIAPPPAFPAFPTPAVPPNAPAVNK